jgi:hypothetical protein
MVVDYVNVLCDSGCDHATKNKLILIYNYCPFFTDQLTSSSAHQKHQKPKHWLVCALPPEDR